MKIVTPLWLATLVVAANLSPQPSRSETVGMYDIVIANVRTIDPETQLDAVRNIGVQGDRIAAVSEQALRGRRMIDGRGLVAAPGFIDLHSHAYGYETATYQAMDGVTTRLELEIGVYPVKRWYERKAGHELINYGASASHNVVRFTVQKGGDVGKPVISGTLLTIFCSTLTSRNSSASRFPQTLTLSSSRCWRKVFLMVR